MAANYLRPDELTIAHVEEALNLPADRWHGRCFEIAWAITEKYKLVRGTPVYGAWTGTIHPGGWWAHRKNMSFVRHGWVKLPRKNHVLDPTRWSFEADEPYIWTGKNDGTYDEGNDKVRKLMYTNRPCPAEYANPKFVELPLSLAARIFLFHYSDEVLPRPLEDEPLHLNEHQLFWLANAPMMDLDPYTAEIYRAIIGVDRSALIPIDNRRMVLGG